MGVEIGVRVTVGVGVGIKSVDKSSNDDVVCVGIGIMSAGKVIEDSSGDGNVGSRLGEMVGIGFDFELLTGFVYRGLAAKT